MRVLKILEEAELVVADIEVDLGNALYSIFGTSHLNYALVNDGARINYIRPNTTSFIQLDTVPAVKFSELHGYLASEAIYAAGESSAIVGANKYIGNVTQSGIHFEDQILKSDVLNHDIFPSNTKSYSGMS